MNRRFLLTAMLVLAASLGIGWAVGEYRKSTHAPESPLVAASGDRGALLYQVYCASCHGAEGHGDGPSTAALRPPPRSFASRPWRSAVTADSIRHVITAGIPGTAMPGNPSLPPADVDSLAAFVLQLASHTTSDEADPETSLLRDAGFVDLRGTATPPLKVVDAAKTSADLGSLKGKLVLVHFWATNCAHCVKEFPQLKALEAELASRGFATLHICTDAEELSEAQSLADKHAAGLRVVADETGLAMARFEVQALPTIWLIDAAGKPIARASGARDWRSPELRRVLENWLPTK